MTALMELYVSLGRHATDLDDKDDELASAIRDLMDLIWYERFNTEERQQLNNKE